MSIAVRSQTEVRRESALEPIARVEADGKFLRLRDERFLVKGVTYGTFAPDADGYQFPPAAQVAEDFRLMAELGINTVRVYTPPRRDLLDEASRHGLRVIVGLPWSQHVAFLDNRTLKRNIRLEIVNRVRELGDHPAVLMFALGNEIPPGVVRWHGRLRVERFLRSLYHEAKAASPSSLFTYVNFPPTEFLDLSFFDVCAFNVYLHREPDLRGYLARLQHIAGPKPFLLAEAGADSIREGELVQAAVTAMHIRAAFEEGACGAVAFAWTDEWWRGGFDVEDWAFGLVDRQRKKKPAAAAVAKAFADAPFSREAQRAWPKISVVVCAYNAADTIDDCLSALEQLTYPNYEVILVNDGSRDRTGELARLHPIARVVDIPNGGLSAARNVGLAEATGDIVAYTDADARPDRDWLTFLVQPFLTSDVVASGGPNVVPPDDPPMAQSIARAPGGPTHVLLDDRIAEHVPGCNMAFKREALLAIDGFNPVYLRAGDDVDVCWRLQARGWKIGFAAAALVWHHHRSSIKAYWRQQVGYGEGERWLMAHHPEKFLDGRMLWHGRIYSALPFVRSLWDTRINAGVWGTAAFPSIYRKDVHPFAFLPHSVNWQILAFVLAIAGAGVAVFGQHTWAASLLLAVGLGGIAATIAKDVAYALRSDVASLPGRHVRYQAVVAYLHFIQPFARIRGQIRGLLSPPEVALPKSEPQTSRGPRPSFGDARRALLFLSGSVAEDRFWSDTWTSADGFLSQLTLWLQRSRAVRTIELDEGWSDDRDISLLVGRWAWLDIRALAEDHGGKTMLRVSTHLRPTSFGIVGALGFATLLLAGASAGVALTSPATGATAAIAAGAVTAYGMWRAAQATSILRSGLGSVAKQIGMTRMKSGPARVPLVAPSVLRMYGLRTSVVFLVMIVALGAGTFMLREATKAEVVIGARRNGPDSPGLSVWIDTPSGIAIDNAGAIYYADSHFHLIWRRDRRDQTSSAVIVAGTRSLGPGFSGDGGPATRAQLDTPDGVCLAPDGDLVVADAHNDRVRRIDKPTGVITTIAGNGESGYNGDDQPAEQAQLNVPNAVACAPNGDIYIADTLNYRIRMIDHGTGLIRTVAGDGKAGQSTAVGDGQVATDAHLNMPSDIQLAPNGDLYIADMHHNRVRKVTRATGIITTVAGTGTFGESGDNGPAVQATLAGPAGLALAPEARGLVTVFVADYYNGLVRAIGPDGVIHNLSAEGRVAFGAPTRVAFRSEPAGDWLYVADASKDELVALNLPKAVRNSFSLVRRRLQPVTPPSAPAPQPAPPKGIEE